MKIAYKNKIKKLERKLNPVDNSVTAPKVKNNSDFKHHTEVFNIQKNKDKPYFDKSDIPAAAGGIRITEAVKTSATAAATASNKTDNSVKNRTTATNNEKKPWLKKAPEYDAYGNEILVENASFKKNKKSNSAVEKSTFVAEKSTSAPKTNNNRDFKSNHNSNNTTTTAAVTTTANKQTIEYDFDPTVDYFPEKATSRRHNSGFGNQKASFEEENESFSDDDEDDFIDIPETEESRRLFNQVMLASKPMKHGMSSFPVERDDHKRNSNITGNIVVNPKTQKNMEIIKKAKKSQYNDALSKYKTTPEQDKQIFKHASTENFVSSAYDSEEVSNTPESKPYRMNKKQRALARQRKTAVNDGTFVE